MTTYIDDSDEFENKLSLIVRKPQEGKTFICITSIISDITQDIHIVLTMNTLSAGMQFFGRMEEKIGSQKIIVFNSDKKSAGNCHHAKRSEDVIKLIKNNNIQVVVCCAHIKRFRESLLHIFNDLQDSKSFVEKNKRFKIHIDEAHKYIPENREYIRAINLYPIVTKIVGYSASPDPIFITDPNDNLFNRISICDVEKELSIIRSKEYFGVIDCIPNIIENKVNIDNLYKEYINNCELNIPQDIIEISQFEQNQTNVPKRWYGQNFPFSMGNELFFFSYLEYVFSNEIPKLIKPSQFSYHFIPAYLRKFTHYQTAKIILNHYNDANVIVINGNGIQLLRMLNIDNDYVMKIIKTNKEIKPLNSSHAKLLLEPSFVIQTLISDYLDKPTFITGYVCVGMSVTLVNETLGNFDSIVMAHNHFKDEDLYQLCRFLFNYVSWKPESKEKIKKTNFISLRRSVFDICLDYEKYIEKLISEYSGKTCTLNETRDIKEIEKTKSQILKERLNTIVDKSDWFTLNVDESLGTYMSKMMWECAEKFYCKQSGNKTLPEKSKPTKDNTGKYICSLTKEKIPYSKSKFEKEISGIKTWHSLLFLTKDKLNYASRIFIAYDDLNDPTNSKYTIYIRYASIKDNDESREILKEFVEKRKSSNSSDNSSNDSSDNTSDNSDDISDTSDDVSDTSDDVSDTSDDS